jgi:hypothetical protein
MARIYAFSESSPPQQQNLIKSPSDKDYSEWISKIMAYLAIASEVSNDPKVKQAALDKLLELTKNPDLVEKLLADAEHLSEKILKKRVLKLLLQAA